MHLEFPMRSWFGVALLTIASTAWTLSPASAAQADPRAAVQVDELFARFDRPGSPGAAVLVVRDQEVVYRKGFGQADLEHGIPVTPATVFDIASLSKQFTGMAVAMLVEAGRIDLDADVRTYLPDLPDFGEPVTVDHLVHHTSGLRDWPGTLAVAGWRLDDVISFGQILNMARHQEDLNFAPGAEYSYSNTGYNILAALVAEVSGQSFRAWTEANIFGPLGMTDTHVHDDHTEIVANGARGYARLGDGFRHVPNALTALGSSSLHTTVDDLAKWIMNFDHGRVGGMDVIERMQQPGVLNDGRQVTYAFGQSVGAYRGLETWSHTGAWAGFQSVLLRFPEQRFGVVILSNSGEYDPSPVAHAVADIFLDDVLEPRPEHVAAAGEEAGEERAPAVAVRGDLLDEYEGVYRLGPGWLVTISRNGQTLTVQATAEPRFPMRAVSQQEFFVEAYGASMTFGRSATGEVDHLTYGNIRAPRVGAASDSADDVHDYVGEFYSEELDTSYRVAVENGILVARHRRHGDIPLVHLAGGEFRGTRWFVPTLEFDRDDRGRVIGFRITQERSRNIRFERRDWSR
jgi:CubicO group peptidase (beta-lactamase class C family)